MIDPSRRVLLLDRDGVLNRDRPDYVKSPEELIVLPGVPEAMARLHAAGVICLLVTNQAAIAKGIISFEILGSIHARLFRAIEEAGGRITQVYLCPHRNEDRCGCRKPRSGNILRAQQDWGFDPARTWMVGDAQRDYLAARGAGCNGAIVCSGHEAAWVKELPQVPVFDNLPRFVDAYLSDDPRFSSTTDR
ncbi:MAG: HAD-IIIA family hydrolase [Magnetococcales bacterium]|nr:HAD-IIIA family hydrolase [Magnetococcales bacterium]